MSYLKQHQKEAEENGMLLIPRHEMSIAQHIRECEDLGDAAEYLYGVLANMRIGIEKITYQAKTLTDEEILEELLIPKSEWGSYKAHHCLKQIRAILKKASEK